MYNCAQVLTKGKMEIEAMTFDLDDTLYDNLPVIKKAGPLPCARAVHPRACSHTRTRTWHLHVLTKDHGA